MTVIAFDTLAFANKLKSAGMSPSLADVQAEATAEILTDLTCNRLATKQDVKELQLSTAQDLKDLEMRMYTFMVKTATFTVGILGSIQTILHFLK